MGRAAVCEVPCPLALRPVRVTYGTGVPHLGNNERVLRRLNANLSECLIERQFLSALTTESGRTAQSLSSTSVSQSNASVIQAVGEPCPADMCGSLVGLGRKNDDQFCTFDSSRRSSVQEWVPPVLALRPNPPDRWPLPCTPSVIDLHGLSAPLTCLVWTVPRPVTRHQRRPFPLVALRIGLFSLQQLIIKAIRTSRIEMKVVKLALISIAKASHQLPHPADDPTLTKKGSLVL